MRIKRGISEVFIRVTTEVETNSKYKTIEDLKVEVEFKAYLRFEFIHLRRSGESIECKLSFNQ